MAIPILGEIERLINEHGSAAIMKDRLALASDQYSALEKKLFEANASVEQLKSENESLHLDLKKAEVKIRNLEEKFIQCHSNPLEEIEIHILKLISDTSKTAKEISELLNIGEEVIKFQLEELKNKNIIESSHIGFSVGDI